jgi:oligopeptide transport system permease protein
MVAIETGLSKTVVEAAALPADLTFWQDVRKRLFRNKLAVIGMIIFGSLFLLGLLGPFIFRGDYKGSVAAGQFKGLFTKGHFLGTDDLGRDMLRRVVRGLWISLRLAFIVTAVTTLLGMLLGGLAGYKGGWLDTLITRIVDAMYAIPYIIVGVAFVSVFGRSFWTIVLILLFNGWLGTARLFRSSVLQIRSQDYIEAARATGADTKRILLNHVLPNGLPPIIVTVAFSIAAAVVGESIYSFLGIGFQEPTPALGVMIGGARGSFGEHPHTLFVPASMLVLLTLSIVFIGDGLRDALDPKLRGAS